MQCPNKFANAEFEARWSKRVESVRKDVECTFGVVKRRFRILKVPIPYRAKEDIDNIMFTCCVLHNILLDHDAQEWTIVDDLEEVRLPAARYSVAGHSNVMDFSFMSGPDNDIREDACEAESTWMTLRTSLITHYKYAKLNGLLRWISYRKGQNSH